MSSLKEVKRRIGSVNGTMKVTSAMGSISAAKLHKTQGLAEHLLPYQEEMHRILDILLTCAPGGRIMPYSTARPLHKVAIILVASNKTFCGAFNSNVVKLLTRCVEEFGKQGVSKKDIVVYAIGNKGADAAKKAGFNVVGGFAALADKHDYSETVQLAESLIHRFRTGEVDRVELIYNHYKSGTTQVPMQETYLPFTLQTGVGNSFDASSDAEDFPELLDAEKEEVEDDFEEPQETSLDDVHFYDHYIVEPSAATLLQSMIPRVLVLKIYTVLLDAAAAEHAARTLVMQQATDNGEKLLQELRLLYNKQRQQAITNELLDIVAGTAE